MEIEQDFVKSCSQQLTQDQTDIDCKFNLNPFHNFIPEKCKAFCVLFRLTIFCYKSFPDSEKQITVSTQFRSEIQ